MNKIPKIIRWTRWIPLFMYAHINMFLALVFILGSQHYDRIRVYTGGYSQYVSGSSNYSWVPHNFYSCAFEYDSTLVAFIFMVICANLITVGVVSGVIQLMRKNHSMGNTMFNIIFSFVYFSCGMTMSGFLAGCCELDTGIPMVVMGFLQTLLTMLPFAYGVFCLVMHYILKKKGINLENPQLAAPKAEPAKAEEKPQEGKVWFCPECGTKNHDLFCSECGTKKPE